MNRRAVSAVLWGVVGALSFLVLHQAYLLVGGEFLGVASIAGVAFGVLVVGTFASYLLEARLRA